MNRNFGTKMIDWTRETSDPLDSRVRGLILSRLNDIRVPLPNNNYDDYVSRIAKGKTVLDIGVCEHTTERMNSPAWKHNIIRKVASRVVGVDIIAPLVAELNGRGYDIRLCDATSETDLGERFNIVHIGDVIEHVNSPVALMAFAKRHLSPGGQIIVRTPNPYHFDYAQLVSEHGTDLSNLEHMFYICPTHMTEIGRRAGLSLSRYLTLYPGGFSVPGIRRLLGSLVRGFKWRHAFAELFSCPERYSTIFVYELVNADLLGTSTTPGGAN